MNLSRKDFLRNGFLSLGRMFLAGAEVCAADSARRVHPPGFDASRSAACSGCDRCSGACPQRIISNVDDVPLLDFTAGKCRRCLSCAHSCPAGVLPPEGAGGTAAVAAVDASSCIARSGCFSCLDHCEQRALRLDLAGELVVDAERCTGCGGCEFTCPIMPKAITVVTVRG